MSQGSSRLHRRDAVACGLRQLAVAAMLLVGPACRRKRPLGKAEGSVTFQGKPVEAGAVIFSNDDLGVAYVGTWGPEGFSDSKWLTGTGSRQPPTKSELVHPSRNRRWRLSLLVRQTSVRTSPTSRRSTSIRIPVEYPWKFAKGTISLIGSRSPRLFCQTATASASISSASRRRAVCSRRLIVPSGASKVSDIWTSDCPLM